MDLEQNTYSVLIVTESEAFRKTASELLSATKITRVRFASRVAEARRIVAEQTFDFLIVNTPLPDDPGIRFAFDIGGRRLAVVLLMLPPDIYAESLEQAIRNGVFAMSKPISKNLFTTAMNWIQSAREQLRDSNQKITAVEEKMAEIRTINRAKWFLISERHMSEANAHRFIEKQAMDRCVTRLAVAKEIIGKYSE